MVCSNCGTQNNVGEKFCRNCGTLLEVPNQQMNNMNQQNLGQQPQQSFVQNDYSNGMNQPMNNQGYNQQPMNNQNYSNQNMNNTQNYNGLDQNYVNNAVNPNMKKWATWSVVVPIAGIIFYLFIGLSFYLAIVIAAAGFSFAQKGEMGNPKLAKVGKVLNGVLVAIAIVMFVMQLILAFNS